MDNFNVPRKVNRHVYKAVSELQDSLAGFVSADLINQYVKYTLRRSKQLVNVDEIIHQSLSNLTDLGVLARTGSSGYAIRQTIKRASMEYTGIPTCDLDSRASSKRSSSARKTSAKSIKRVSKSKAKRILGSKSKAGRDRAPIKRLKREYTRGDSLICLGCRTGIAGLVDLCKILKENNFLQMVKLEKIGSNPS
ncbi:uncharacterized protein LOC6574869 [Drosophila mojavensis]|uniref:Uncharacterized protein n=1 Tax=Drosophila mojavensis TaxID=7230 RepID=B4K745_DROMO|nr:uncharacterized protein LOC6574869 [Drosophila mojavensis]EDW16358.1 uncharacterized protein Dmoj_GI10486 [Drosophila mojavensis]